MAEEQQKKPRPKRRTRLSRQFIVEICEVFRATSTPAKYAVEAAGVSESAYYEWLERGKADLGAKRRTLFAELAESVSRAQADGTKIAVAQLRKLALEEKDWRGLAWELERTRPKEFSPRLKIHIESEMSEAIARLKKGYADDPVGLEKALRLLVGEFGGDRALEDPIGESGSDAEAGEAVHPPQPEPASKGVPRADGS